WGKSWVGINWAAALHELEGVNRVLVVTVTSGLGVWEDQIAEHCPVPFQIYTHLGECVMVGDARPPNGYLDFMIVNYPNLYTRARTGSGADWVPVANRV